jgi:hypothetical protein
VALRMDHPGRQMTSRYDKPFGGYIRVSRKGDR